MTKIFKHAVIALMLVGSFTSCSNKMDDDLDPEKAILGKWELVLLTRDMGKDEVQHTPTGYIEYLPEGQMAWYDYSSKVYTLFEEKYCLADSFVHSLPQNPPKVYHVEDGRILHYETTLIEVDNIDGGVDTYRVPPDFPDKPHGHRFFLKFIDKNTLILNSLDLISIAGTPYFIYKRKN